MASVALDYEQLSDIELAALVVRRDATAVRRITRRNNQRLCRAAWSVLENRAEAEEAVQTQGVRRHRQLRRQIVALHLADADPHQ